MIVGTLFTIYTIDKNQFFPLPNMPLTKEDITKNFIFIFTNNVIVFLVAFFTIRLIAICKNKIMKGRAKYGKSDQILYMLINSVLLFKTGISMGYLVTDVAYKTQEPLVELYLKGILPHGIIELTPFVIAFYSNYNLIVNRDWVNANKFNRKLFITLCLFIFIAALIESTLTPFLLYSGNT